MMDFDDTPEQAAFRAEARAFLESSAELKAGAFETWRGRYGEEDGLRRARDWQRRKADAGFAAITWPREYGGRGGSQIEQVIYGQEEARFFVPRGYYEIGLGMCIPT